MHEDRNRGLDEDGKPKPDKIFRRFTPGPLKGRERAQEKVRDDYQGDIHRLTDVGRCSLVMLEEWELEAVTKHLLETYTGEHPCFRVVRFKNRFKR